MVSKLMPKRQLPSSNYQPKLENITQCASSRMRTLAVLACGRTRCLRLSGIGVQFQRRIIRPGPPAGGVSQSHYLLSLAHARRWTTPLPMALHSSSKT